MKEYFRPNKRIDYKHYITYNGIKYTRTETLSLKHFSYEGESKLRDLHTIKWEIEDEKEDPIVEYFSNDKGWSKNGFLNKENPTPDIEKKFKETIGKNLIYF